MTDRKPVVGFYAFMAAICFLVSHLEISNAPKFALIAVGLFFLVFSYLAAVYSGDGPQ